MELKWSSTNKINEETAIKWLRNWVRGELDFFHPPIQSAIPQQILKASEMQGEFYRGMVIPINSYQASTSSNQTIHQAIYENIKNKPQSSWSTTIETAEVFTQTPYHIEKIIEDKLTPCEVILFKNGLGYSVDSLVNQLQDSEFIKNCTTYEILDNLEEIQEFSSESEIISDINPIYDKIIHSHIIK